MKVEELIKELQGLDKEADIFISLRKGYRPVGYMKEIKEISPVYDQDTNKRSYFIDVDIEDNSLEEK